MEKVKDMMFKLERDPRTVGQILICVSANQINHDVVTADGGR
jgi:hypothetical protein